MNRHSQSTAELHWRQRSVPSEDNTNGIYTRESGRSCDDAGYRNANNAVIVFGGGTGPGWLEGWHIVTSGHIRYYHPAEPGSTIPEGQWLQRTGGGHGGSTPEPGSDLV